MANNATTKYRNMMKRMEEDDELIVNPERPAGMMGGTPDMLRPKTPNELPQLKRKNIMRPDEIESIIAGDPNLAKMKIQPTSKEMIMRELKGITSDAEADALRNATMAGMGNEMARSMGSGSISDAESEMIQKILGATAPSDFQMAVEALKELGLSERAILEILASTEGLAEAITPDAKRDTMPTTMTEGALGSLPQRETPTEMRPESFGADRTQSMEMQKEAMGT